MTVRIRAERETDRQTDRQRHRERGRQREREAERVKVSKLVFYAQSTGSVISGR